MAKSQSAKAIRVHFFVYVYVCLSVSLCLQMILFSKSRISETQVLGRKFLCAGTKKLKTEDLKP